MFSFNKKASTTPAADSSNDHPNPETTVVPVDFLPLTSERVEPKTQSPKPLVDENKPKSPEPPANEHEPESPEPDSPEPLVDENKPESPEPPADEHTSKSRRLSTALTSTERRKSKAAVVADFFAGAAAATSSNTAPVNSLATTIPLGAAQSANTAAANTAAANTAAANTAAANTAAPTLADIGVYRPSHHPQIAQSLGHFRFPADDNSAVTLFPTDNNNNSSTALLLPTSRRTSARDSKRYAGASESESESETNTPHNHNDDPAPMLNGIDFNQAELGGPHDATPLRGSPSGSKSRSRSKSIYARSRSKPKTRKTSRHNQGTRRRKLKQLRQRIASALRAFARLIRKKAERVLAMFKSKKTKTKTKAKAKQGMVVLNLYPPYGFLS